MMILIFTTGGQRCSNLMSISLKMDRWSWLMIRSQKYLPTFSHPVLSLEPTPSNRRGSEHQGEEAGGPTLSSI